MAKKTIEIGTRPTSDLDDVIDEQFGNLTDLSKVDTKVKLWYSWGIYSLNYISSKDIHSGVPAGRITSVKGLNSTGKSLLLASLAKDPKIDKIVAIGSEGGGLSAELFEFAQAPLNKIRISQYASFASYKIKKSNGEVEEVPDSKFPVKADSDDYRYIEGATRFIRRFINAIEFKGIKTNIVIMLDSLANMKSVREIAGGCLPGETKVIMSDGSFKEIKNISSGDIVLTHLGTSEKVIETKIITKEEKPELLEIETEEGDKIKLTPNHPLLIKRDGITQWMPAGKLLLTDEIQKINI